MIWQLFGAASHHQVSAPSHYSISEYHVYGNNLSYHFHTTPTDNHSKQVTLAPRPSAKSHKSAANQDVHPSGTAVQNAAAICIVIVHCLQLSSWNDNTSEANNHHPLWWQLLNEKALTLLTTPWRKSLPVASDSNHSAKGVYFPIG